MNGGLDKVSYTIKRQGLGLVIMTQPVTQKKLIINNRNFGYFITLLKIKFIASQLASKKKSLPASPSILC